MPIETVSVEEFRDQLPDILERFRTGDRTPVGLESQGRLEAVIVPVQVYEELITSLAQRC